MLRNDCSRMFVSAVLLAAVVWPDVQWAIVGGAVRDVLLASEQAGADEDWSWPDLDIAVLGPVDDLPVVSDSRVQRSVKLAKNSFGGWKMEDEQLGEVDVWSWPSEGRSWEEELNRVDFGLNAIAFTWPSRQVVMHARWSKDLALAQIEKVHPAPSRPELQAVRASALAEKLTRLLGMPVAFSPGVQAEVDWLLQEADEGTLQDALAYFAQKVKSGRWQREAIRFFSNACEGCQNRSRSERARQALTEALSSL